MSSKSIWAFQDNFDFRSEVQENSPLYVPLEGERGDYSRRAILKEFKLDDQGRLLPDVQARQKTFVLFGGHVGSGKSTELRQLAALFKKSYTVSHLELTQVLDINSLRFSDLLIALAQHTVGAFETYSLRPNDVFVKPVVEWFETRIIKQERFKDLEAEAKTGASAQGGIPFLASILATFTAKVRAGVTYREELRNEVRNGFTQLAGSFNALIAHANDLLIQQGAGPLLFIIDGTDKLKREDSETFFQSDVNQLGQIQTNVVLCAPIAVLLEDGATAQRFDLRVRLPMVKIFERDESEVESALRAMVTLVSKRLPLEYFDDEDTLRYLVRQSGGHPRDLLRLIRACFSKLDAAPITRALAERAARDIATEYQRCVLREDWAELVKVDLSQGTDTERTQARLRMLYDLVLLEYNNYWWRSHPLARLLSAYTQERAKPVPLPKAGEAA